MKRITHQKQCVLTVLRSMRGRHPTAEAVYEEAVKIVPSISRATVYRILNQHVEQGIVGRIPVPDSAVRYDDWMEPHHHLLCNVCRRLFDLPAVPAGGPPLPQGPVAGHTITGVEVIFRGVCSGCAQGGSGAYAPCRLGNAPSPAGGMESND